jgi:hypothetical protein
MMKRTRFAFVPLAMLLGYASLSQAQAPAANLGVPLSVPDISKLNVTAMLQQMNSAAAQGNPEAPSPLQIVVQFLQLQPSQQPIFGQLLQARQAAVTPFFEGITQREQQLEELLSTGGNPAQVGILVIQIHALQQQIVQTQQSFLANLANLLTQDQQQRLAAVHVAVQLQPVVPAFQVLQLF